jgi:tRNA(fMet)-specific endonuclease VapC
MYLLDTNICIYLINGNPRLRDKVKEIGVFSIGISYVTLAELYFGAYNSRNISENLRTISIFKRNLNVYSDDVDSAELFGKIKATLKASGCLIEDFDILIASIAISNNCVLVTNNVRHFDRIESIQIENWRRN